MAWSKGAVVIVKRGDEKWANEMEQALVPVAMEGEAGKDVSDLERKNDLTKIHDTRFTDAMIEDLTRVYGPIKDPAPKWLETLLAPWTLLIYLVSVFWDKYMTIHEPEDYIQ